MRLDQCRLMPRHEDTNKKLNYGIDISVIVHIDNNNELALI